MAIRILVCILLTTVLLVPSACSNPNPQPAALSPIPSLAAGATLTLVPQIQGGPTAAATARSTSASPVSSPQASPSGAATAAATVAGDATAGAAIFAKNCASCHGAQAEGGDGPALRNNQFIKTAGDAAVYATIANGRPGTAMPAWSKAKGGSLSDTDIYNVIAFLHTLQNAP